MNQEKFEDIIKQKADNHAAPVPPDAWDNIAGKKKKNPYPFFWWSLSSVIIAIGLFVFFNANKKSNPELSVNNQYNQSGQTIAKSTEQAKGVDKELNKNNSILDNTNNALQNNTDSNSISLVDKNNSKQISTTANLSSSIANNEKIMQPAKSAIVQDRVSQTIENENISTGKNNSSFKKYSKAGKVKFKTTSAEISDDATTNETASIEKDNKLLKKYNSSGKVKFKTTAAEPSADTETNEQADNNIVNKKNAPNINTDNSNEEISTLIKTDTSTNADKKLIAAKPTKPPIDTSLLAKKDTLSNQPKNNTIQKNINAKATKNPALILDFSITPFSPIQHYSTPLFITRSSSNNAINTTYITNSIKTSLQFSASFAFALRKNISRKFIVGTGLQYTQIKENTTLSGIDTSISYIAIQRLVTTNTANRLVNDSINNTTTGNRIITATNSYRMFSVPVFIQYNFINHTSFSVAFTGGSYFTFAQYNNSIAGKLESIYANGIQADNEKNNLVVDIFAGLRFTKLVHKNFSLFAEPNFRHNLTAYKLKNTFLNKNIDAAGISFGLSYKIK